jgi:hypothetical protein
MAGLLDTMVPSLDGPLLLTLPKTGRCSSTRSFPLGSTLAPNFSSFFFKLWMIHLKKFLKMILILWYWNRRHHHHQVGDLCAKTATSSKPTTWAHMWATSRVKVWEEDRRLVDCRWLLGDTQSRSRGRSSWACSYRDWWHSLEVL